MTIKASRYNIIQPYRNRWVVFNSFTKASILIDQHHKEAFELQRFGFFSCDELAMLKNNGFVVPSEMNEIDSLETLYRRTRASREQMHITLVPSLECNFSCPYCFENASRSRYLHPLDFSVLKRAIPDLIPNGVKSVSFTLFGGEPLLYTDKFASFFDEFKQYAKKHDLTFSSSIVTNGLLLSPEVATQLALSCNLQSAQITLDGNKEIHDRLRCTSEGLPTFDIIRKNISSLLQSDIPVKTTLRINLLDDSIDGIRELLNSFSIEERPKIEVYFRPIYNTASFSIESNAKGILESCMAIAKQMNYRVRSGLSTRFAYCEGDGGKASVTVMPDLTLWKCINDLESEDAKIGVISQDGNVSFEDDKVKAWASKSPFRDQKCRECIYLPMCWGGCPRIALTDNKRTCFYEKGFDLRSILPNL